MDAERRIATMAARQHGLITRTQAREAGLTDRIVERRLGSRRWVALRTGVYRIAGAPPTWEQTALATCLAAGHGTVVCGPTAAKLWAYGCKACGRTPSMCCRRAPGESGFLGSRPTRRCTCRRAMWGGTGGCR